MSFFEIVCGGLFLMALGFFIAWVVHIVVEKVKELKEVKKLTKLCEQPPEVEPRYDEVGYIDYRYAIILRKKRIKNAEKALKEAETNADIALTNLQEKRDCESAVRWREARRDEMLKRAMLNNLQNGKKPDECLDREFLADFAQIKSMREVKQIYLEDGKLNIMVRATYPYKGLLYDVGDYLVGFYKNKSFVVFPIRAEWEPYCVYNDNGSRVFGFDDERQSKIESYLRDERVVEALELIIDSLCYIEEYDCKKIPSRLKPIRELTKEEKKECKKCKK